MRWHWQNLNEDRRGNVKGSGFWFGRAWFTFTRRWAARVEWQFGKFMFRQKISFDPSESEIMLSFALPGISLYLSMSGFRFLRKMKAEREIGITIHDWALWWSMWERSDEWNSRDPWWMRGCLHIDNLFLGKQRITSEEIEKKDVGIPMPEGVYPAHATLKRVTYKRPRWFTKRWYYVDLDIPIGIPHEGKGENSWDCGEDGLFGISANGTSYEAAIGRAVESVMTSRRKYGMQVYPSPKERMEKRNIALNSHGQDVATKSL